MTWKIHDFLSKYFFDIEFYENKKKTEEQDSNQVPKIFLCNHRSFADFFVDNYVVGGAMYISRMMVIVAIPFPSLLAYMTSMIGFFVRSKNNSFKVYELIDKALKRQQNVIVYPEGTRNQGKTSKSLKWGIIRWAYKEKVPVQIVMTSNKEKILNEKTFQIGRGIQSKVEKSVVLFPEDVENIDEWCELIQLKWDRTWDQLMTDTQPGQFVPLENKVSPNPPNIQKKLNAVRLLIMMTLLVFIALQLV